MKLYAQALLDVLQTLFFGVLLSIGLFAVAAIPFGLFALACRAVHLNPELVLCVLASLYVFGYLFQTKVQELKRKLVAT